MMVANTGFSYADIMINSTLRPVEPAFMFEFERQFRPNEKIWWLMNNWQLSIAFSVLYVVLVFSGRSYMKLRQPYNLRIALAVWSACLAGFSWMGTARFAAAALQVVRTYGWHDFVCDPGLYKGVGGFWLWIFTLSKVPELGDTVFIVLRKQNLIFLHWYHHITVLMFCWYSYPQIVSLAPSFCLMNFTVHSLMYSYYAIKASRLVRIPSSVGMVITSLQILQMMVGCITNGYAFWVISNGRSCATNRLNMQVCTAMYFSYFLLFSYFFYDRYVSFKRPASTIADAKKLK